MKTILNILFLFLLFVSGCNYTETETKNETTPSIDLSQIKERGKIIAVTDYHSANYFIYKGRPMGYQFELLQDFADHIGLPLELKVESDINDKVDMLENGECDIIAVNIELGNVKNNGMNLCKPHSQTNQVLIQRKNNRKYSYNKVSNVKELAGKTIYVPENSSASITAYNLISEIRDTIYIREVNVSPKELIEWVSTGRIDYTICYENEALINRLLHKNIDIDLHVSSNHNLAWGIRSTSPELQAFINDWVEGYKKTRKYQVLYKRYFKNGNLNSIAKSDFSTFRTGKMSNYDNAIKKYSESLGWDWKLLASLIYQESRFNPNVKSWAGAYGIMQLMPRTAKRFGVDSTSGPEEQIRAGVKFLQWLDKRYENDIEDTDEKIKFILASYNVGYGHVQDARRLAKKNNKNPNVWEENVEFYLLQKSNPEFYNDDVVKYGYCRGTETFKYVKEIIERYQHYTNLYVEN